MEEGTVSSEGEKMFLTPEEMEQADMLDNSEEELLRPMLQEWLVVVKKMKRERAIQEQKIREVMKVKATQQYKQSRKLMKAVTFYKWIEYMFINNIEKKEMAKVQKEASGNLAKSKLKPTKEMLKRRNSVLGVVSHSPSNRASGKHHRPESFLPMMMMMEDRENVRKSYEELQAGKREIEDEFETKMNAYKILLNRHQRAQATIQMEKERLSVQSHSREFDPYFLMKVGSLGVNNLVGLPLPKNIPKYKRKVNNNYSVAENFAGDVLADLHLLMGEGDIVLGMVEKKRMEREKKMEEREKKFNNMSW